MLGDLVLTNLPVFKDLFEPKKDLITTVKITLGMELDRSLPASLSGNVPGVALWDELGRSIGTVPGSGTILPQGNFVNVEIQAKEEVGNVRPSYLAVSTDGDDAICIAALTITFPDGANAAWNGDIGATCGAPCFLSSTEMGDGHYKPKCVWIGKKQLQRPQISGIWHSFGRLF